MPQEDHGIFDNHYYNVFNETVDPESKVEQILKDEMGRLQEKKTVIDPLYNTKLRQDAQTRSMTLRKNAYNYIILVIAFAIGLVMSLFVVKNYFPLLPEWLMDTILIVTISCSIIYVIILYEDILKRDLIDFDKVDFGLLMDIDKVKQKGGNESDGAELGTDDAENSAIVQCEGRDCCPNGSFFWGNRCNKTESFSTSQKRGHLSSFSPFSQKPSFMPV